MNNIFFILGLDPAKPGFYHVGAEHIDAESARFVDILHTDAGFYGALENTGTADFFANGGTRAQPGCPFLGVPLTPTGKNYFYLTTNLFIIDCVLTNFIIIVPLDLCNHWRSWRLYAESVKNIYAFPATQCSSYGEYMTGRCRKNPVIFFGYATPRIA